MERIEINGQQWTIEAMRADWAEDDTAELTPEQVREAADAQYAWLINSAGDPEQGGMRGWSYTGMGFTGSARSDAIERIFGLISGSVDYVLSVLEEIKQA